MSGSAVFKPWLVSLEERSDPLSTFVERPGNGISVMIPNYDIVYLGFLNLQLPPYICLYGKDSLEAGPPPGGVWGLSRCPFCRCPRMESQAVWTPRVDLSLGTSSI